MYARTYTHARTTKHRDSRSQSVGSRVYATTFGASRRSNNRARTLTGSLSRVRDFLSNRRRGAQICRPRRRQRYLRLLLSSSSSSFFAPVIRTHIRREIRRSLHFLEFPPGRSFPFPSLPSSLPPPLYSNRPRISRRAPSRSRNSRDESVACSPSSSPPPTSTTTLPRDAKCISDPKRYARATAGRLIDACRRPADASPSS